MNKQTFAESNRVLVVGRQKRRQISIQTLKWLTTY